MWSDWQGGSFALPPGADFCRGVVAGLMARVAGIPPEALAELTIYVNAGRTLRSLREAFDDHARQHGPILLPRLRLIADLGAGMPGERAAPLARVLDLGRLVSRLIAQQPGLGAGQSVPDLAQSLADLMTEMQFEGCDQSSLSDIDARDHAAHWQRSLRFLHIAAGFYLGEPVQDQAARQRRAAQALADLWAAGRDLPQAPVIVAGSTGSHGATRLFLQAVAAVPLGTVILPGYDFGQPDSVWDSLGPQAEDHPQARLAALRGGGVQPWHAREDAPAPGRNRLVSLALRPAPVTDQWISEGPGLADLAGATAGLTLIEADQPQQEADAIAILIRDAVGRQQPVRLITSDRGLVRRIAAVLDRWDLQIEDSAGEPLQLSAAGLFLRHVAGLFVQKVTVDVLLTILKDPVTATGGPRGDVLRHTRDLELRLRRHGPAFPDAAALRDWADGGDASRKLWCEWLAQALDIVKDGSDRAPLPVPDRLAAHRALADWLAAGPGGKAQSSRLWNRADGQAAQAALRHLADHADRAQPMTPREYADLIDTHLARHAVRGSDQGHPLIRYFGTREARTEANRSDGAVVVLAGLNEGGWPQALAPDPWLSRLMRQQAGLTLPERQIGLAAHDFQQAIAAPQVVLTRARRDAEAETIPSRWLNRLTNLMSGLTDQEGPAALQAMRQRGGTWLALARQMAEPRYRLDPAPRPAPVPPAPAFAAISVTGVARLIRDPYAVYADKVLGLRALDPLRPEPDASLRGQVLHLIVERLLTPPPAAGTSAQALRARFLAMTAEVLAQEVPWPAARAFWQARMERIATRIARDEAERLQSARPLVVEASHSLPVPGLALRLTARPDRIDLLEGGAMAHVYDYKSGNPPTDAQMEHFDKQLLLEAAMVAKGAFPALGPVTVQGVSYIQLGGEGATQPRKFTPEAAEETWQKFVILAGRYLRGECGFAARRALQKSGDRSDYDHLSRYGEWGTGDAPVQMRVGDHD